MTDPTPEKQGVYQHHRDNQQERILEAAETLFIRDGIDNVSMSAIADEARIARKTLYRYFNDKDAIAYAIYQKLIDGLAVSIPSQAEANAYTRLEKFMAWLLNEVTQNRNQQRFLIEFNTLYARQRGEHLHVGRSPSGSGAMQGIAQIIRDGIADGSLRADLQPESTAAAFLNLLVGMNARFALLGDLISAEYGQSGQAIYAEICRIFLRGLQPPPERRMC